MSSTDSQASEEEQWIVAKFGGTSLGKFMENIAEQIVPAALNNKQRLALVCSARSGDTKATGTTNLLLRAAAEALQTSNEDARELANDRHDATPPTSAAASTSAPKKPVRTASSSVLSNGISALSNASCSSPATRSPSPSPFSFRGMSNSISSLYSIDDSQQTAAYHTTVDQIKADHLAAAKRFIKDDDILAQLEEELEYDCERLRSFLTAAQILDEISLKSRDIIMGVGEKLSCRIVAAVLQDRGIPSELVTLETIIEKQEEALSSDAPIALGEQFYNRLATSLGQRLRQCGDRVPVVTGFFGIVPGSLLSQIGRGYTDLCAALCAVGLNAAELQIWKEVDGIFTADPRKVPTARVLSHITPEEAAELTYYGSEVIHPFTMEQVIKAAIPIRIKNVENPLGAGTVIYPDLTPSSSQASLDTSISANPTNGFLVGKRLPTAVTIKDNILMLNIRSNRKTISHGFFAKTFTVLDRHGIIVDLISTSEVQLSLSMHSGFKKSVLDKVVAELSVVGEVTYKRDLTILSLVGKQMKNMVGIAGRMFTVLAEGNVNIEAISQGASEINTSCVIDSRDAIKALNLVHHHLLSPVAMSGTGLPPKLF